MRSKDVSFPSLPTPTPPSTPIKEKFALLEAPRKMMEGEQERDDAPETSVISDSAPSAVSVPVAEARPQSAARHPAVRPSAGRSPVPVLLLSVSVGRRNSLERMLEGLLEGLDVSVQIAATLRAARTALHAAPHAAALIDLPVPGLHTAEDLLAGLPAGHLPPLLTLGQTGLEGYPALTHPVTPDLLREALTPLLPQYPLAAVPGQTQRVVMADLMAKPGVLGVTLLDGSGHQVAQQGETLPAQLGLSLIGALEATRSFGGLLHGGALHTVQLEYAHRTLLLAAHGKFVMACILRDPSTSSLIRYLLRTRLAN